MAAAPSARSPGAAAAPAADDGERLALALRQPRCYPGAAGAVEVIETHMSRIFLVGADAYKVKKAVRLPFADFTSAAARHFYCREEVRLNRRTAPGIYLGVVPIEGPVDAPIVGGEGPAVEYAVHMRRFGQAQLLDALARDGSLLPAHIDVLARGVAHLHENAARSPADGPFGAPELARQRALDNLDALDQADAGDPASRGWLREWTLAEWSRLAVAMQQRRERGFVRECHGDLHLGNIVLADGVPTPFDCIEFDPALRTIDVMSDVAFTVMDLERHGLAALAARFLDRYLAVTGDYEGLVLLRFYAVYRALVRAKIAMLTQGAAAADVDAYLRLAVRLAHPPPPAVVAMHGVAGSGKSVTSEALVEVLRGVRLRSDVERKRMHGLAAEARSDSGFGAGLYAPLSTLRTYARLEQLASTVLDAGHVAIVDATFLARGQRDMFRALAERHGVPFAIVACEAPVEELRRRVAARRNGFDPSEADVAVLEHQLAAYEPLDGSERATAIVVDTARSAAPDGGWDALLRRLQR